MFSVYGQAKYRFLQKRLAGAAPEIFTIIFNIPKGKVTAWAVPVGARRPAAPERARMRMIAPLTFMCHKTPFYAS